MGIHVTISSLFLLTSTKCGVDVRYVQRVKYNEVLEGLI